MDSKAYNNLMNEGADGFNPMDAIEERTAEARFQESLNYAGWTIEGTKERRAAWNEEATKAKKDGRKINLLEMENKMGFRFEELKVAVKHYGL